MNSYMESKWSWIDGTHGMRTQMMELLNDADLAYNPGGKNMTFGALCREMGEVEHAYVESLKHFKQDFTYRNTAPGLDSSVAKLKAWYEALDAEMKALVSAFSEDDLKKTIERAGGFNAPVDMQLDIYLQALLIFFGKAMIYLKGLNKDIPQHFQDYIG